METNEYMSLNNSFLENWDIQCTSTSLKMTQTKTSCYNEKSMKLLFTEKSFLIAQGGMANSLSSEVVSAFR